MAVDLVAASETQDNMQCCVVLNAIVLEGSVIFQLFASPKQSVNCFHSKFFISFFELFQNNFQLTSFDLGAYPLRNSSPSFP